MKIETVKITRMFVLLIASAWLASNAEAQTAFPSLSYGTAAGAIWDQQTECGLNRLNVGVVDGHGFNPIDRSNPVQSLFVGLSSFDTCTNQVLMNAVGFAVLPRGAFQFDQSLAVHAFVEVLCIPGSPPCDPFPVEVNLTWIGLGDISRFNAGVGGNAAGDGFIEVCPSEILDREFITGATRSAEVTGDVTASGTSLLQGLISNVILLRTVSGSMQVFPNGASGPPFCLCSNPGCS